MSRVVIPIQIDVHQLHLVLEVVLEVTVEVTVEGTLEGTLEGTQEVTLELGEEPLLFTPSLVLSRR